MNALLWLLGAALSCLLCSAVALAEPSAQGAAAGASEPALLDLNRASVVELTRLPGIGTKRAEAIVAFRASHGGFQSVTQLLRIKGIGRAMLRKLRLLVMVTNERTRIPGAALATAPPASAGSSDIHRVR